MLELLDKYGSILALKWQFMRDKSRGLEAVKVDTERDNETFWQHALLPLTSTSDQQLCVTLAHAHTHRCKGKKRAAGLTDETVLTVLRMLLHSASTNSFSSTRHFFLPVNGLPLSQ